MTIEDVPWMQNKSYSAREDRILIASLWNEGIMRPGDMLVAQRGAGANMSVDIGVGSAVIDGDDQTNQGSYLVKCTALENIAVTAAPGSNSRLDIACIRINDPNATGPAGDNATFIVVAGTPAASPTVPATPTSAIRLAVIGPILTSTTSITTGMIANDNITAGRKEDTGVIKQYAGTIVPNGWLAANGQAVSRATFSALFAQLGTVYGVGDGSTTFNVPDLRGRVAVGLDNMLGASDAGRLAVANTLGGSTGAETAVIASANLPTHTHVIDHDHGSANTATDGTHTHELKDGSAFFAGQSTRGSTAPPPTAVDVFVQVSSGNVLAANTTGSAHAHAFDMPAFSGASGSGGFANTALNIMQPSLLVNYIIRT